MVARRRGAQPGNTNALKHGFYSSTITLKETRHLDNITNSNDLTDEVILLRALSLRLASKVKSSITSIEDLSTVINTLSTAFIRIASLQRTQLILNSQSTDIGAALAAALENLNNER